MPEMLHSSIPNSTQYRMLPYGEYCTNGRALHGNYYQTYCLYRVYAASCVSRSSLPLITLRGGARALHRRRRLLHLRLLLPGVLLVLALALGEE